MCEMLRRNVDLMNFVFCKVYIVVDRVAIV